jgi:hypothetical protein
MNIKTNLKRVFAVVATISLGLLMWHWFSETDSPRLIMALLVLNAITFMLALPSSVFAAAAIGTAWYVLELDPRSGEGVFLNTILLAIIGAVEWFWLERFWYPTEAVFYKLDIDAAE